MSFQSKWGTSLRRLFSGFSPNRGTLKAISSQSCARDAGYCTRSSHETSPPSILIGSQARQLAPRGVRAVNFGKVYKRIKFLSHISHRKKSKAFVTFLGVGQTRNRLHGPSNGKRNLQGIATKPSVGFTRAESRGTDEYVQVSLAFRWGFAGVSLGFRWRFVSQNTISQIIDSPSLEGKYSEHGSSHGGER